MSELIYDKWGNPIDSNFANADSLPQGTNTLGMTGLNYGFNSMTNAWDRIRTMGNTMDGMASTSVGLLQVMNSPMGFNGSTFDRLRSTGNNADAVGTSSTGNQQMAGFNYGFNGTTYDRMRTGGNNADALATSSLGIQHHNAFNMGFNGTTFDRLRSGGNNADGVATSSAGIQNMNAFNLIYNGTTYDRQLSAYNMMNGMSGKGMAANTNMAYNGATYDNVYNNSTGTFLASGARTTTTTSPTATNFNARGIAIYLNITIASGTGGLTVGLFTTDPISGNAVLIGQASSAVTTVSINKYMFYPSLTAAVTGNYQTFNAAIDRTVWAKVTHGDATSYTYSVGYSFIL